MVLSFVGLETKDHCAGEDQKHFNSRRLIVREWPAGKDKSSEAEENIAESQYHATTSEDIKQKIWRAL
jgi:hypothetical protein